MKRKQLLFLLALLITAATGAWAQQVLKVKPITQEMATTWAEDNGSTLLTPDHLPGFCPATEEEAKWWDDVPQEGTAILIYHIDDPDDPEASTNVSYVQFEDGQYSQSVSQTECAINSLAEAILNQGVKIFYTWAPTYTVKLADGTKDAANWTIVPAKATDPEFGVAKGKPVTLNYKGRLKVKAVTATHDGWNGDLSNIPASALEADGQTLIVPDGTTLKGTLDVSTTPYKIVIPDDATVTLAGVTIDGENDNHYRWAGINLEGDAIIILADYTENTVEAFYEVSPGIHVPKGKTLTIQGGEKGTGKLTARSNGRAAGIGGGYTLSCGHIRIEGGDITAFGGRSSAGIGGGNGAICGDITITGGTVTATGGPDAAGIGSGYFGACGDITITDGVTLVTATKGEDAPNSIGAGDEAKCGTVTIGGTVYWQNNAAVDAAAATYLAQPKIVYPDPLATPLTMEAITDGIIEVTFSAPTSNKCHGMKYSVNGGTKTTITTTRTIEGLKAGDKVQFYGIGTSNTSYGFSPEVKISGGTAKTKVYGNIMSLLYETGFATKTDLQNAEYVFYKLFAGNTTLIDASELLLPAATLADYCYQRMFEGCTNLTTAPKLPAETLADACYEGMFEGCINLTTAYVKAAYTDVSGMCSNMFDGCSADGATLHTTHGYSKDEWETKMGPNKTWSNWTVADDWQD